jgi:N-acetyl-alpha-D-muramate 1-phosphate uridylyltransferase
MTRMPPIAVLAGGLATRMRPLTEHVPKALLEVAGENFVAHQLRLFAREGIRDVTLLVGYCWQQIKLFVGNGSRFGVTVDYIVDGPTLLGTGGAIRRALDRLGPEFLVTYCELARRALCAGCRRVSRERTACPDVRVPQ